MLLNAWLKNKKICLLCFLLFSYRLLIAQILVKDTIVPAKGNKESQLREIKQDKIILHSDTAGNQPKKTMLSDTTKCNKYDDLLNDDPEKAPLCRGLN